MDRSKAEVEFRLAIIPPLFASRSSDRRAVAVRGHGCCHRFRDRTVAALFRNAEQAEREANDVLLDSLFDRRVRCPALDLLEVRAADAAAATEPEAMERSPDKRTWLSTTFCSR